MIEDGNEDVRMVVVEKRDAATLISIIQKHVKPGTTIHTDCWKAYDDLDKAGYVHFKGNHSGIEHRFVAADGTHTQRIEATWPLPKDWSSIDRLSADVTQAVTFKNLPKQRLIALKTP